MELFEVIRRGYAAGETIQGLSKKHGVHRRMVRQAIASAIPPERKPVVREAPRLGPVKAHIDQMLASDLQAPRKQRHTAHRIWTRLRNEHPDLPVGEATVRRYVQERKRELGLSGREVFVPQSYELGQEAQVDWFEGTAILGGEARKLQFFAMRSMGSGDAFHRAYLQRVSGYCLTGNTREHAMFFFYGTGANGKSVFVEAISGILGDYAKTTPMETFTASHNEPPLTNLATLRGARLVTATETEEGQRWAEAKLKLITGGERIAARFMRQDLFEYAPQFKLMISGNHRPRLRNVDEAMRRRFHLAPFAVTILPDRRDKKLADKLRKEWGGVLQWAVEGCLAWQRDGLQPPRAVTKATKNYLEDQDVLRTWLAEKTVDDKGARANPTELYRAYKGWAEASNEYVWSQKQFSQKLEERGYIGKKSHGSRYILGLRLKEHTGKGRKVEVRKSVVPITARKRRGREGAVVPITALGSQKASKLTKGG